MNLSACVKYISLSPSNYISINQRKLYFPAKKAFPSPKLVRNHDCDTFSERLEHSGGGAGEQVCRVIIRPRLAGLDVEQRGSEIVGGAAVHSLYHVCQC